jgi:hypothetical protein
MARLISVRDPPLVILVVRQVKESILTDDLIALAVALILGRHTRVLDELWIAVGDTHEGELGREDAEAPADTRDIVGCVVGVK